MPTVAQAFHNFPTEIELKPTEQETEAVRHETTHPAHAHQCWRELFGAEYKS